MVSTIIQIFITGLGILAIAIIVNFLAKILGLETWYSFIEIIQKNGLSYAVKIKWTNLFFLFFVYPFILGLSAYFFFKY